MANKDEQEDLKDRSDEKEIRKKLEQLRVCPYCQSMVEFVWLHGHYQCPFCRNVVIGCCGDS